MESPLKCTLPPVICILNICFTCERCDMSSTNKRSTRVVATFLKQTLSRSSFMMLCHYCFLSYRVYKMDPSLSPRLANADHLEGKKLTIKKNERILGKFTSTPFASEHAIISISLSLFQSLSHSRARTHALTLSRSCTHAHAISLSFFYPCGQKSVAQRGHGNRPVS